MSVTISGTTGVQGNLQGNVTGNVTAGLVTTDTIVAGVGTVPIGAVFYFATSVTPVGYLICDGSVLPNGVGTVQGITADFSKLFAILGTTYGVGATTGALPDLRGEFIRGLDGGKGTDPGRVIGTAQADALKSHTHTLGASTTTTAASGTDVVVSTSAGSTGATGTTETRPRNIALLPCIKY
jgi:microcystin-dependent protein